MSRDDMSESDPWKEILPVLPWHYGTVKWRPRVDGRWNCCSEMFSLDYWWIVSLCNTHGYVWKYILYSYMKGFGQVRFNFDDIWQRVNFDAQRASEQTGKLSGGPRVFDPRVRQIFRATPCPDPIWEIPKVAFNRSKPNWIRDPRSKSGSARIWVSRGTGNSVSRWWRTNSEIY